ncbi:MAG: thiamine-phosphate kinase [Candidatus Hodarchaeota archaeon]
MTNNSRQVGEVGERKLIEMIMSILKPTSSNLLPHPDDAVAVRTGKRVVVLKTDTFVGSTDMPPRMTLSQAGWKSVIMNISDLAAKGAKPKYFLMSLCIPRASTVNDVLEITKGIDAATSAYDIEVLGGDTNESRDIVITGTLVGEAEEDELMSRRGTKPDDLLAVTGAFGYTGAGLAALIKGFEIPQKIRDPILRAVLKPMAPLAEGLALAHSQAVSSCIDSSDGLLASLGELMNVNEVGFLIEDLPAGSEVIKFAEIFQENLEDLVLSAGEEYELVFTFPSSSLSRVKRAISSVGGTFQIIGKVIGEKRIFLRRNGDTVEMQPRGYEHFKSLKHKRTLT